MIPVLTLTVCSLSLVAILYLCWALRPIVQEQEETHAIGFQFQAQEDPYDDSDPGSRGC